MNLSELLDELQQVEDNIYHLQDKADPLSEWTLFMMYKRQRWLWNKRYEMLGISQ